MFKRLAWVVLIVAAATGGCLTGSGAIRGDTDTRPAADPASPAPAGVGRPGAGLPAGSSSASPTPAWGTPPG
jgi:hypothetical protein